MLADKRYSRIGWPLSIATGFGAIFVAFTLSCFGDILIAPYHADFISLWSAGHMVLHGQLDSVYNIAAHHSVERTLSPTVGLLPFAYPPPFLAIVAPLALLPFGVSQILWVTVTLGGFLFACRRVAPLPYVLATPPLLFDSFAGQTGFFAGGLFIGGLSLVASRPFSAGAVLGLLILKPQLALMLPVAMIAGRQWRTIGGAIVSSVSVLAAGLILFGGSSYRGFFAIAVQFGVMLHQSGWSWIELISPFAFLRYFEVGESAAIACHLLIAAAAAGVTWTAWSRNWDEKIPILAAASLLASPYLFTYDAGILIVPAGCLVARKRYWTVGLLWLLSVLPVVHVIKLYHGPNTIPLAALIAMTAVAAPHFSRGQWRGADAGSDADVALA